MLMVTGIADANIENATAWRENTYTYKMRQ